MLSGVWPGVSSVRIRTAPIFTSKSSIQRDVWKFRVGLRSDVDLRAGACGEFFVTGNKVGVQVGFEDVSNRKVLLRRRLQINVNVALWIHHRRFALRSDQVRGMRQTG